jgi:FlaG/FlaF family flagellin (archaellin)
MASFSILPITIILAASVASVVTLIEFGSAGTAQSQANPASSLTPQQKAAICDPNDTHVNATESRICGKPVTASGSSANATTTSSENNSTSSPSILPLLVP